MEDRLLEVDNDFFEIRGFLENDLCQYRHSKIRHRIVWNQESRFSDARCMCALRRRNPHTISRGTAILHHAEQTEVDKLLHQIGRFLLPSLQGRAVRNLLTIAKYPPNLAMMDSGKPYRNLAICCQSRLVAIWRGQNDSVPGQMAAEVPPVVFRHLAE